MGWYWHRVYHAPRPTIRGRIVSLFRRRRLSDAPDLAASSRADRMREEDRRAVLLHRSPLRWALAVAAWAWLGWAILTDAQDPSLWFYLFWIFLVLGPWLAVFSPSAGVRVQACLAMILLSLVYGLLLDHPVRGGTAYLLACLLLAVNAWELRRRRKTC